GDGLRGLRAGGGCAEGQTAGAGLADPGPAALDAVPALIQALKDRNLDVACKAARALGRIGPAAAVAVDELEYAAWRDRRLALAGIKALGRLGPAGRPAQRSLLLLVRLYPDRKMRRAVTRALHRMCSGWPLPDLEKAPVHAQGSATAGCTEYRVTEPSTEY